MVAQAALVLWMVVGVALFALTSPLRAFLLTYVVGYLFLPVEWGGGSDTTFLGSIYFTQSLRIDKLTACNIAALVGTFVFAPDCLRRFRFHWVDAVFVIILAGTFLTSVANGLGVKDGSSHIIELLRQFAPLIFLSRLHIATPEDLLEAMRAIIGGAFVYAFLCVGEWRFSPQTHRLVYGYFQHSFDQFMRYGHFRGVGFLRHAIETSFFMGTATALAAWLWLKGLLRPLWGIIPAWGIVLALFAGLIATLTYSGVGACLGCAAILALIHVSRSRWLLLVLPVIAILWMGGRYTGIADTSFLARYTDSLDPTRAESLSYREESERTHIHALSGHLIVGKGPTNGVIRDDEGEIVRAVDAWWLITLVFYGLVGLAAWYLFWGAGIAAAFRSWLVVGPDTQALIAAIAVMLGAQFIDFLFNAFPSPFLMILAMGAIATLQNCRDQLFAPTQPPTEIDAYSQPDGLEEAWI